MTTETEMNSKDVMTLAMKAVQMVNRVPVEYQKDYLEFLGHVATKFMRAVGGDQYVRDWLQAAMDEAHITPAPFGAHVEIIMRGNNDN